MRELFQEFIEVGEASIVLYEADKQKETGFLGTFEGVAHNVGRITKNKTLYRRTLMHREVDRIQDGLAQGKVTALADHPNYSSNEVLTLAVRWTEAAIDEKNDLRVKGGILKTFGGSEIKKAREGGVLFGLSLRGRGDANQKVMDEDHVEFALNRDKEGEEFWEISDDYEMETPADIVLNPSSENSFADEKVKEALARLEAASQSQPEELIMTIKDLKSLSESVSADALKTITEQVIAEAKEGIENDAVEKATAEHAAKLTEATDAVLKDDIKIAEAAGLTEPCLTYVRENKDKLEVMAETHHPIGEPVKPAPEGDKTEEIKNLTTQVEGLVKQVADSEKAREGLATEMKTARLNGEKTKLIDECTKGEALGALLTDDVMERYSLSEDFDPDSDDSVKTEKTKILDMVKARKEYFASMNISIEGLRPTGKGKTEGGDAGGVDDIRARREAFAEKYPDFAVKEESDIGVYLGALASADDPALTTAFHEAYGADARKALPI